MSREPTVAVGKITRAHGVKGEVAVLVLSEVPERFDTGAELFLEDGRSLVIEATREDRGRLLVTFAGVTDRSAAEPLLGRFLVVPESTLLQLPDGSWWPFQLEGCSVSTDTGRPLGVLTNVVPNPANDIWVVVAAGGETLVPALKDVIVSVDVAAKRIVVREIRGLTVPEDP